MMNQASYKSTIILSFIFFLVLGGLPAQESHIYVKDGLAASGYDPVAYFIDGKATKGNSTFAYIWEDAEWYFRSEENLEAFKKEPEKYAPQYGGYCAYAVAIGRTAKSDPRAWKIVDEKLYLNFNRTVQKKWEMDISGYVKLADQNWPKVLEN